MSLWCRLQSVTPKTALWCSTRPSRERDQSVLITEILNELKLTDSTRDAAKTQTTCCHCLWQWTELSTLLLIITSKQRLKHPERLNTWVLENCRCYHVRLQQSSVTSSHTLIKILVFNCWDQKRFTSTNRLVRKPVISDNIREKMTDWTSWNRFLLQTLCCLLSSLICDLWRSTCSHLPSFHLLKKVSTSEPLTQRPHRNIRCSIMNVDHMISKAEWAACKE